MQAVSSFPGFRHLLRFPPKEHDTPSNSCDIFWRQQNAYLGFKKRLCDFLTEGIAEIQGDLDSQGIRNHDPFIRGAFEKFLVEIFFEIADQGFDLIFWSDDIFETQLVSDLSEEHRKQLGEIFHIEVASVSHAIQQIQKWVVSKVQYERQKRKKMPYIMGLPPRYEKMLA